MEIMVANQPSGQTMFAGHFQKKMAASDLGGQLFIECCLNLSMSMSKLCP